MPYPVPPPKPPAIIQSFPYEQLPHAAADSGVLTPGKIENSAASESALSNFPKAAASEPALKGDVNQSIALKDELETRSTATGLGSPLSVGVAVEPTSDSDLAVETIRLASEVESTRDISTAIANLTPVPSVENRGTVTQETASPAETGENARPPLCQQEGCGVRGVGCSEEEQKLANPGKECATPLNSISAAPTSSPVSTEGIPPFPTTGLVAEGRFLQQLGRFVNREDSTLEVGQVPELPPSSPEVEILPAGHMAPARTPIETQATEIGRQAQTPATGQQPVNVPTSVGVIEVTADRQNFDEQRRIFTAEGNVIMRFQGAVLDANRVQGNLLNFIAVAEGDAALTRGQQVLRGDRFVYNFIQNSGTIQNASGIVFSPTSGTDLTLTSPTGGFTTTVPARPLSDRLIEGQPPQQIVNPGGVSIVFGRGFTQTGQINRTRFEAEQVEFYPRGWTATNIRLTNDPFSPPELEIRADRAVYTQISPLRDEILLTNSRFVFDQRVSIPTFRRRIVIDRTEREPPLFQLGYDARERGGLFVERTFNLFRNEWARLSITPQFLAQRAITRYSGNIFNPNAWGFRLRFNANLSPRTVVQASAVTPTLLLNELPDRLRSSLRLYQVIGTRLPHTLSLEYSYRDRLFNGSLGFQTVRSSLGAVITSPVIPIGRTGINLTYQGGVQYINARSDRIDLLNFIPGTFLLEDDRIALGRFQLSAELVRPTFLWRGQPLPATATEGLRYTPVPVVPFLQLVPSIRGTTSIYTSGDTQQNLLGSLALRGQFGHFSRPFLDYTGFNLQYIQIFRDGLSPFLFDRIVDTRVLSFGITQQIYGPFRLGFQTSINLNTGENISTDYILEYSRRTYGVIVRYNPQREIGSINLRISDFNWTGGGEEFGGSGGRFVDTGVIREEF